MRVLRVTGPAASMFAVRIAALNEPVHRLARMPFPTADLGGHDVVRRRDLEARHRLVEYFAHDVDPLTMGIAALHFPASDGVDAATVQVVAVRAKPFFHSYCAGEDHIFNI